MLGGNGGGGGAIMRGGGGALYTRPPSIELELDGRPCPSGVYDGFPASGAEGSRRGPPVGVPDVRR